MDGLRWTLSQELNKVVAKDGSAGGFVPPGSNTVLPEPLTA